jgi:hypothetical protein
MDMTATTATTATAEAKGKACMGCGEFYRDIHGHFDRDGRTADGYKARCKTCDAIARREAANQRRGPAALRAAQARDGVPLAPLPDEMDGGMVITLDLSEFPHICEAIQKEAEAEFRTPEMQILYWLVKNVRAAAGTGA